MINPKNVLLGEVHWYRTKKYPNVGSDNKVHIQQNLGTLVNKPIEWLVIYSEYSLQINGTCLLGTKYFKYSNQKYFVKIQMFLVS